MPRDAEVSVAALERELEELAGTIRRACGELDRAIADGRMESNAVDEAFRWIWHLKRRRECILSAIGRRRSRMEVGGHVD